MAEPADRESGARALEVALLGGPADLTREQVEAESGDVEATRRLWRALGFVDLEPGVPILSRADAEALHRTRRLVAERGVDERTAVALARALGQAMGHLAEAQVETVAEAIGRDPELAGKARADPDAFVAEMLPLVEPVIAEMQELMLYVWRRHLVAAGQRSLAGAAAVTPAAPVVVGFADVVNYTSVTRDMRSADLAALVEDFEDRAFDAVARHGGRVVKTLGDEVMFTAATPQAGAEAGLALAAEFGEGRVPPVRAGSPTARRGAGRRRLRPGGQHRQPVHLARPAEHRDRRSHPRGRAQRLSGVPAETPVGATGSRLRAPGGQRAAPRRGMIGA